MAEAVWELEAAGDDACSLADLYEELHPFVYRFCLGRLKCPADAEDAAHDVFARAAGRPQPPRSDLLPWLYRIASSVCIDEFRRRQRDERVVDRLEADAFAHPPVVNPEASVVGRLNVIDLMARLTRTERAVVRSRVLMGNSHAEIGEELGMTEATARGLMGRARRRLADYARAVEGGALSLVGGIPSLRQLLNRRRHEIEGMGPLSFQGGQLLATGALVVATALGLAADPGLVAPARPGHGPASPASQAPALPANVAPPVATRLPAAAGQDGGAPGAPGATTTALLRNVPAPGGNASQQDTAIRSMTASPAYDRDHTIFATGFVMPGCAPAGCPAIFVSHDAGATWAHLPAWGFAGGTVLLPPDYPANPTVFAAGAAGLERSDDGGVTFVPVLPAAQVAAAVPATAGGAEVLAGTIPLTIYHAGSKSVERGPALPLGMVSVDAVVMVTPTEAVISGQRVDAFNGNARDAVVLTCPLGGACAVVATYPGETSPRLAVPASGTGTVFAYGLHRLEVSVDGGAHFASRSIPSGMNLMVMAPVSGSNAFLAGVISASQKPVIAPLQAGSASSVLPGSVFAILPLADGQLLAAMNWADGSGHFGIRCSGNGGASWSTSC